MSAFLCLQPEQTIQGYQQNLCHKTTTKEAKQSITSQDGQNSSTQQCDESVPISHFVLKASGSWENPLLRLIIIFWNALTILLESMHQLKGVWDQAKEMQELWSMASIFRCYSDSQINPCGVKLWLELANLLSDNALSSKQGSVYEELRTLEVAL